VSVLPYCIVPAGHPLPAGLEGVGNAPVDTVGATDGLDIWLSPIDRRPDSTADAARTHHHVVAAAMDRRTTPVPLRFGQLFADEAAAAAAVARHAARWAGLLQQFAGKAEYGVRISLTGPAQAGEVEGAARDVRPAARHSGMAYMADVAARHAAIDQAREEAERLSACLTADGVVADSRASPSSGAGLLSLAHLVAWSDAEAYHAFMKKVLDTNRRRFAIHCTGPWPPYSFVE
jgi:hypothetical protein